MVSVSRFSEHTLDLRVKILGETLELTIRPYAWTVQREAELFVNEDPKAQADAILDFLIDVVASWSLTTSDGEPYPLTHEALDELPSRLLLEILNEIKEASSFRGRKR